MKMTTRQIDLRDEKLNALTNQSISGAIILKFKSELYKRMRILEQTFEDLYGDDCFDDEVYTKVKNVFLEIDEWSDFLVSIDKHQYDVDLRQTIESDPLPSVATGDSVEESKQGILKDFKLVQINDFEPKECGSSELDVENGEMSFIKSEMEFDDIDQNSFDNDEVDSIQGVQGANYELVSSITIDTANEESKEIIFRDIEMVKTSDLVPNECSSSELSIDFECGEMNFIKNELEFDEIDCSSLETGEASSYCPNESDLLEFKCDVCGESFNQHDILKTHQKLHSIKISLECDICGKVFRHRSTLGIHLRTHSGDRPYKCDICGRAFYNGSGLKAHSIIHSDERPYKCKICGRAFSHKCTLKTHLIFHSGERPFECNICGKKFPLKPSLKVHLRSHSGEKLFKCESCGKTFTAKSSLTVHLRMHTGEKPFKCDVCGKAFKRKNSLTFHLRLHTGENPFKCDICGMTFSQNCNLTRHSLSKHG